ncbi:MAG: hypothetical protein IJ438_10005 [Clostridia bacterium]|nr:hypothetical protein [Clostridia bacterium]
METSLTVQGLKEILLKARTDIVADLGEHELLFYHDEGGVNVTTDRLYTFHTWDEMLAQPIFWGKRLEEVVAQFIVYW